MGYSNYISSKTPVFCGSETRTVNKTDTQEMQAA